MNEDWLICNKWRMAVNLPDEKPRRGGPFSAYRRSFISKHTLCREALFASIGPVRSAVELFGGLGCSSTLIRHYCKPETHVVHERDPGLCEHLRGLGLTVREGDVYDSIAKPVLARRALLDADFGDFTIHAWRKNKLMQLLWAWMFNRGHRHIVTTDIAEPHLHLHRARYGALLHNDCGDYPEYLDGMSRFFHELYGYSVARAEANYGSCSMLWLQQEPSRIRLSRTWAAYEGVALCST